MNVGIFIAGVVFGLMETAYFGWNLTPQSDAEMICDGITVLICALSCINRRHPTVPAEPK